LCISIESGAAAEPQPQNINSSSTELDNLCQRVDRKTFTKAMRKIDANS
jgi:hypothetical protein